MIEDGDLEANIAYFCLHEFGWEPSKYLDLPIRQKAFVYACIDRRNREAAKQEAEAKRKAKGR